MKDIIKILAKYLDIMTCSNFSISTSLQILWLYKKKEKKTNTDYSYCQEHISKMDDAGFIYMMLHAGDKRYLIIR